MQKKKFEILYFSFTLFFSLLLKFHFKVKNYINQDLKKKPCCLEYCAKYCFKY